MISLVLPSTSVLASTTPVCLVGGGQDVPGGGVAVVREPRSVLPSTAIARLSPADGAGSLRGEPGSDRRGEPVGVQGLQQPADHRL